MCNYNNTKHTTIKCTSNEAQTKSILIQLFKTKTYLKPKFKINEFKFNF